jgi:hypothetical protein
MQGLEAVRKHHATMGWIASTYLSALAFSACAGAGTSAPGPGRVHTHYVAADEVQWNYAPRAWTS